jgi:hypothetical protein
MFNLCNDPCDAVNSGQIDLNPFLDSFLYGLTGTPGTPEPVVIKSENKTKYFLSLRTWVAFSFQIIQSFELLRKTFNQILDVKLLQDHTIDSNMATS